MTAQGWLQIVFYVAVLTALTPLLGGYMARVYQGERVAARARPRPGRAADLPAAAAPTRGASRTGRPTRARCSSSAPSSGRGALRDPAHPGDPPVQPGGLRLGALGRHLQHHLVVHHEHELAVLRRRDDALVLLADGRAGGAELRLGGGRDGGAGRGDPRHRQPRRQRRSATSGRTSPARCSTSCCRSSFVGALVLVSQGVIQTLGGYVTLTTRPGADQTLALGPGRLADRDQAARHQRRRLLQRQLRDAVREPDGVLELRRGAVHPADPRRADGDLRAHGRQPPPGLGAVRGDGGDAGRRHRGRLRRRAERLAGAARGGRRSSPPPTAPPAATSRARSSATASPTAPLGRR